MAPNQRGFFEEVTVAGNQLVDKIKELIEEGNIRRLIIKDRTGSRTLLEVPLNLGMAAGAGLAVFALPLAILGGIATTVSQARIIIERYEDPSQSSGSTKESGPTIIEIDDD